MTGSRRRSNRKEMRKRAWRSRGLKKNKGRLKRTEFVKRKPTRKEPRPKKQGY